MKWFGKAFRGGGNTPPPDDDRTVVQPDATITSDTLVAGGQTETPALQPGDTVGDYRIIRLLAEGGMGQVFLAHRGDDPTDFAVKTMTVPEGPEQRVALERWRREVAIGRLLVHPNVCRLFEAGASGHRHFLAMEYLDGQTLKACIEEQAPMALPVTCYVMDQVLRGLEAIHAAGVVHRDLKPANIMLLENGSVKIMDLGISRLANATSVTRTGSALGTPQFIAPEQVFDAKRVDHRVDLFGVGLLAYQMLSGKLPYDAPRLNLMMARLMKGDQTPLSEHRSDLPEAMLAWVGRLIRHNPDERYASTIEARQDLESIGYA